MAARPQSTELRVLVGRVLGDFEVREPLDAGGFGVVYKAEQRGLGREAVIKFLRARHSDDPTTAQRFSREAMVASRLDHPYAAHIYAFGVEPDGLMWIAMELVRGISLEGILENQGCLPLQRFAPLFQRICEVVHAVHELGIVHRDLKPANIMVLSRGGQLLPKLLDFGVAKDLAVVEEDGGDGRRDDASLEASVEATAQGALTSMGARLGTPPYMAPELWRSEPVGPRTDLYALGALAYRVLTGRYPFDARTERQMQAAHLSDPMLPLGAGFPEALDAVLRRAMAKRYADRYADALELGAAFLDAATPRAPAALPALDEGVRDAFAADAPQPIAEAVALVEAAGTAEAVRAAAVEAARIVARYLALVALAARLKVGAGPAADPPELGQLLRRLCAGPFGAEEWVALCVAALRSFASAAPAHPVPELVELFFDERGQPRPDPFDGCWAPAAGEPVRDARAAVETLGALLRRLSFIGRYALLRARQGRVERWTGVRRARRVSAALAVGLPEGQLGLVDESGALVLGLSPLLQVLSPAPRADEEVFFLAGRSRAGARLVAFPEEFQHDDPELLDWLAQAGFEVRGEITRELSNARPPYLGLSAFAAEDAQVFYGRERECEIVLNRLRTTALVAIVGASGAGKSSFVAAGVVAALGAQAHAITVRPGPTPLAALEARLAREGAPVEPLARDPGGLGRWLEQLAGGRGGTVLLVIDQFEELFTLGADAAERRAYVDAICAATQDRTRPVRVVLTLRDDFLMRAQEIPALREPLAAGLQLLATPGADDLLRILVEPARQRGFAFDDPTLPREMIAQVLDDPSALPLLSFTASRLWEQRDTQFKQLTRRAYTALGGVAGALARHAQDLLEAMSEHERRLVREAFRHLVTAEGTRAVLRRAEVLDLLGGGPTAEGVIEKLIAARLVVAQEADGQERIEIVHEALVRAWPSLVAWRQEDAEGARLRDQLRAAARQWDDRGRPEGLLWRGDALTEILIWRGRHGRALTRAEADFLARSDALARGARRTRRALVAAAIVVLALGATALGVLAQRASKSARAARDQVLAYYEEEGRRLVLDEDPMRALAYLRAAWAEGRQTTGVGGLISAALAELAPLERTYVGHRGRVFMARLTDGGKKLVTSGEDGTLRIWDRASGRQERVIQGFGGRMAQFDLLPDGRVLADGGAGRVGIWRLGDGALLHALDAHAAESFVASTSADGTLAAQATPDAIFVWRVATASLERRIPDGGDPFYWTFVSPDGGTIATLGFSRKVRLFRTSDGGLIRELEARCAPVLKVRFSGDGRRLVTTGDDGGACLYDGRTGAFLRRLGGHAQAVREAEFDATGTRLLTGSDDRTARLWDLETGQSLVTLLGHRGAVTSLRFSEGERQLITGCGDGVIRVFDDDGRLAASLVGHLGQADVALGEGGEVLSVGNDGTVRAFRPARSVRRQLLRGHTAEVRQVAVVGAEVLTETVGDGVQRWDLVTGRRLGQVRLDISTAGGVTWSPDGALFAAVSGARFDVVEAATRRVRFTQDGLRGVLSAVVFTADGGSALAAGQGHELRRIDARTGRQQWAVSARVEGVIGLAVDPADTLIATSGLDGTIDLYDSRTGRHVRTIAAHRSMAPAIVFDADGRRLLSASLDNSARVWTRDGQLVASFDGHPDQVFGADFVGRDRVVTAAADGVLRLWDIQSGRQLHAFTGHLARLSGVAAHPRGDAVVSASADRTAIVWDVRPNFAGTLAELDAVIPSVGRFEIVNGRVVQP